MVLFNPDGALLSIYPAAVSILVVWVVFGVTLFPALSFIVTVIVDDTPPVKPLLVHTALVVPVHAHVPLVALQVTLCIPLVTSFAFVNYVLDL